MLTRVVDYPYDKIEEAQEWWKNIDLPEDQKDAVGRGNAILLFKLPLEP
jgi:2,3-dihydroxybenzoate decarboxylase